MSEKEYNYKKPKFGYDKEFNNSKEYMQEFRMMEEKPSLWRRVKSWLNAPHYFSRGQVVFIASTIFYLVTPELEKFGFLAWTPAFLKYWGAAILAGVALFILTKRERK